MKVKVAALSVAFVSGLVWGQTDPASNLNPNGASGVNGLLHLQGVSVYTGYYSSGAQTGFEVSTPSAFLPGPSASGGMAATIGGTKTGEKSTFTWNYSPSYFNIFYSNNEVSNHGSVNHRGGVNWNRKLGNKWTLSSSANGYVANLEQLYFNQGILGSVAAMPTTFEDLAAAMLTDRFTDPQLASLLTGAPLQATPEQGYLYGNRILNVAANMSLAWVPTGRTSVSVNFSGARIQHLNGAGASSTPDVSYAPQTTTATVGISWSYSLSPRTQIGAEASSMRTFTRLQQGYATKSTFSLGRTMSRRWFVSVRGGAGEITYAAPVYTTSKTIDYLYGAGLGFKTSTYTFLVSYDKSIGDVYGLGSTSTDTGAAAWTWQRIGSGWSVSVNGNYQKLNNATFQNTESWRVGAGVGRRISPHLSMSVQYIYLQLPTDLQTTGSDLAENGVNVSVNWSPSGNR